MKSFLLFIKRIFYLAGIDISFVKKEDFRSALEMNDVETMNLNWSTEEFSKGFLSKGVIKRLNDTLSVLKDHQIDLSGSSVIDVGCGNGVLLKILAENFNITSQTGMEYAEAAIEVAQKYNPAPDYIVHDINQPYSGQFGAVICTEVLEHIPDPEKAFGHLLDMVQEKGILLVTVPNGRIDTYIGHINFWSPESWEVFVRKNSGGLRFSTGGVDKNILYSIVYK